MAIKEKEQQLEKDSQSTISHAYWSIGSQEVLNQFGVETEQGLSDEQVEQNREKYGKNLLREKRPARMWDILVEQLSSIIVLLLFVAAIASFSFQQWSEGIAIVIVLVLNTLIGFLTELKAKRSMEALREMGQKTTKVVRNGNISELAADEIVPGDIVVLEGGDIVSADIRLIESSKLSIDESALTGESVPVAKNAEQIDEETELAERTNMLHKGTAITNGSAKGIVTSTGMSTELGKISSLTEAAEEERTPLEERLDQLGTKLVWLTLGIALVVIGIGLMTGKDLVLMIKTGIALAVAAIPEGLPIVATIALAKGMWMMAKENALINKLSSVETLGSVTLICTDKTGTLTENKMTARTYELDGRSIEIKEDDNLENNSEALNKIIKIGALCNNASLSHGDPMEAALLKVAEQKGLDQKSLAEKYPQTKEEAFDPDIKMMATYHESNGRFLVAVKGASEEVLKASTKLLSKDGEPKDLSEKDRQAWQERSNRLAFSGLRVLALAYKEIEDDSIKPYQNLILVGLVGLLDPPRKDVREAIKNCKSAGIKVVMVTGDQKGTANNIAQEVALAESESVNSYSGKEISEKIDLDPSLDRVFYRVNPKQKLDLIEKYQKRNEIVAMTGDGVNDAPALKKADIGIAMGQRGTQVAKDVSDMVLEDDHFKTIVAAIQQGRIIFTNIRRFVLYLLSCNMSEILIVSIAVGINTPLPILPLQILYLNLITDVFPALALGLGEGDDSYLQEKPRDPREPILKNSHWFYIALFGCLIMSVTLAAFQLALKSFNSSNTQAVSMAFLTLGFAQLFHVFNMKHGKDAGIFINDVSKNPYIWFAIIISSVLLAGAPLVPGLNEVLGIEMPNLINWSVILGLALVPLLIGQILIHTGALVIDTKKKHENT